MEQTLIKNIDHSKLPKHIAIIMDGNGRWAKKRGMLRTFGHKSAVKAVRSAIEGCDQLGVPYLTLYAFSSENWNRPMEEVGLLMDLLMRTLRKETQTFHENNISLRTIGNAEALPKKVKEELFRLIDETKNNTKGVLTLALSYGAKEEITQATKTIAKKVKEGKLDVDEITEDLIDSHLYTADIPDVDLMIRTSGECRISNFLLWQIAYAELYFTDVLWPDFRKENLFKAVIDYQNRERRFGKIAEQLD